MVNPKTIAMVSSSDNCSFRPASSSSDAIEKETDTDRSEPIPLSAPAATPPTPPMPSLDDMVVHSSYRHVSAQEAQQIAADSMLLMRRFFDYQGTAGLYIRRLAVAEPEPDEHASAGRLVGALGSTSRDKMPPAPEAGVAESADADDADDANDADAPKHRALGSLSCGAVVGATLGEIVAHVTAETSRWRGESAAVARQILSLLSAVDLRGAPPAVRRRTALQLAGTRVVRSELYYFERPGRATQKKGRKRKDILSSKPHETTADSIAIGCVAAILCVFEVLCDIPANAQHFRDDDSIFKMLSAACLHVARWGRPPFFRAVGDYEEALRCELEALDRAAKSLDPENPSAQPARRLAPRLQIRAALKAAFQFARPEPAGTGASASASAHAHADAHNVVLVPLGELHAVVNTTQLRSPVNPASSSGGSAECDVDERRSAASSKRSKSSGASSASSLADLFVSNLSRSRLNSMVNV